MSVLVHDVHQHIDDLVAHDGRVVHRGDQRALGCSGALTVAPFEDSFPDGSPDPDHPGVQVHLAVISDAAMSLDEARAIGEQL